MSGYKFSGEQQPIKVATITFEPSIYQRIRDAHKNDQKMTKKFKVKEIGY